MSKVKIKRNTFKSKKTAQSYLRSVIDASLESSGVVILPPADVKSTISLMARLGYAFDVAMLDPWYNKGFGGVQDDYMPFFLEVIKKSGDIAKHVFFWGFPEIVAPFVERIPPPLELVCWLTWYYKNNPSVIRGWRSSQNACLHLSHHGATLFPERFLNDKQKALAAKGKLRYMPGPTSVLDDDFPPDVIEQPLLVGFVGKKEQTGHPSQKPLKVYDRLLQMTVPENGLVFDPMCGSGTAGAASLDRGFRAILCDKSEEYTSLAERRLDIGRLDIGNEIEFFLKEGE